MKRAFLLLLLFATGFSVNAQTLVTYPTTPYADFPDSNPVNPNDLVLLNPSTVAKVGICGEIGDYRVGQNDDFAVRVRKDVNSPWIDLFEYNTFVNSSSVDLSGVTRSSFVAFDYSVSVIVEITCRRYTSIAGKVLIRPLSRSITPTISGNKLTFTLTPPSANSTGKTATNKLSVEINGNRYSNLQIFANALVVPPSPPVTYSRTYYASGNNTTKNIYRRDSLDGVSKKILIKQGAIVRVPYDGPSFASTNGTIKLNSNDQIYIEGGGILQGGIMANDVNNIKIQGHGIIDLTNLPKQTVDTQNPYAYIQGITVRRSDGVTIDGLTINDSQQLAVELTDNNNVTVDNVKIFTRVIWGDGFNTRGCNNISINDCYVRTSDDCISIYASKRVSWDIEPPSNPLLPTNYQNRDVLNYTVTNTLLYADNAHAVEIGWHGNQEIKYTASDRSTFIAVPSNNIYNVNFNEIDVLEHDQNWVNQDGSVHSDYDGALSINCGEGNICSNFLFKNVRVEDFTNGRLLSVNVEPGLFGAGATDGKIVSDIRFENLSYNGYGERASSIKGLNCDRYVNGVHFENFSVNGVVINDLSGYNFITNEFAYNITFQEANNYSTPFSDPNAVYTITDYNNTPAYKLDNAGTYVSAATTGTLTRSKLWKIVQIVGTGHYRIIPYSYPGNTLENSFTQDPLNCQGRYLQTSVYNSALTAQQWKIVGDNTNGYKINNAYTRAYLTYLSSGANGSNTLAMPKNTSNLQKWKIVPYTGTIPSSRMTADTGKPIEISPNPAKDYLKVYHLAKDIKNSKARIIDLNGREIMSQPLSGETPNIYIGELTDGIYLIMIESEGEVLFSEKFVKGN